MRGIAAKLTKEAGSSPAGLQKRQWALRHGLSHHLFTSVTCFLSASPTERAMVMFCTRVDRLPSRRSEAPIQPHAFIRRVEPRSRTAVGDLQHDEGSSRRLEAKPR